MPAPAEQQAQQTGNVANPGQAAAPKEDFAAAWERAQATAEALEKAEGKAGGKTGEAKPEAPTRGKDGKFQKTGEKTEPAAATATEEAATEGAEQQTEPAEAEAEADKNEGKPTIAERAKLRQERREFKQRIAAKEQELSQKEALLLEREKTGGVNQTQLRQWRDTGDYDAIAKAAGVESFNELVQEAARAFASPEYRRIKALEERERERARQDAEREKQTQAERVQAHQAALRTRAIPALKAELSKWERPEVAALASEDDDFVAFVYDSVNARFGPGESPSEEDLREEIDDVVDGIVATTRKRYERWQKVFGNRSAEETEDAQASPPVRAGSKEQPARPHKHVSKNKATEATGAREKLSDADSIRLWAKRMEEAAKEDREAQRRSA